MARSLVAAALVALGLLLVAGNWTDNRPGESAQDSDALGSLLTGQKATHRSDPAPQPEPSGSQTNEICAASNWTPATRDVFQATVTRTIDGDTLAALAQGQEVKIRLWGVDAPETDQPMGREAKITLSSLAPNHRSVRVHAHGVDRYGRVLAVLEGSGKLAINASMVEKGMAYHLKMVPARGHTCLSAMEQFARTYRQGVWRESPQGTRRPWEHRQEEAEESYWRP